MILILLSLIVYCATSAVKKKLRRDSLTDVFAIFLYTGTFINGVKLAFITFRDNTFNIDNIEDSQIVYTIVGGLVIAWIAFYEITNKYKKLNA